MLDVIGIALAALLVIVVGSPIVDAYVKIGKEMEQTEETNENERT